MCLCVSLYFSVCLCISVCMFVCLCVTYTVSSSELLHNRLEIAMHSVLCPCRSCPPSWRYRSVHMNMVKSRELITRHWGTKAITLPTSVFGAGDNNINNRGQQGNDIPVPTPVHSSPKGECGLLPEHNEHHMKRRCNHLHCLASIFLPAALCLWA